MQNNHYSVDLRKPNPKPIVDAVDLRPRTPRAPSKKLPKHFSAAALALIIAILFAPMGRVYAQEETETAASEVISETAPVETPPVEEVIPSTSEETQSPTDELDGTQEEVTPEVNSEEENTEEEIVEENSSVEEEIIEDDIEVVVDEESVEDEEVIEEDTEESPEEIMSEDDAAPLDEDISSSTESDALPESILDTEDNAVGEAPLETEETLIEEDQTTTTESKNLTTSASQYVFNSADCIVVRSGEFYCISGSEEGTKSSSSKSTDAVAFAKNDSDGDLEIYLKYNGETIKVTNNTVDDDAPVYDPDSQLLVWHTQINDRYQIMAFDPIGRTTYRVTSNDTNNAHPFIHGNVVAWQAWEDDNWEIFYAELPAGLIGSSTPARITHTSDHDMFPKVYKHFITWQSRVQNEWKSYAYDMVSGTITYLGQGTDGSIESARVVLLVEKRNAQGNVETVGYELESGEAIALGTDTKDKEPAPLVPSDPIQDQQGVLPSTSTATTTLKTSKDGDGDDPSLEPVE